MTTATTELNPLEIEPYLVSSTEVEMSAPSNVRRYLEDLSTGGAVVSLALHPVHGWCLLMYAGETSVLWHQGVPLPPRTRPTTREGYLARYPRICAHIICASLGYATPLTAAGILKDARDGSPNFCEWIDACFGRNPVPAVQGAIQMRHSHEGFMSSYPRARATVDAARRHGQPSGMLGSWF